MKTPVGSLALVTLALSVTLGTISALAATPAQSALESSEISDKKLTPPERMRKPTWAVELAASPSTFGGASMAPGHPSASAVGTSIQVEYQPAFFQRYGVLGAGPVLSSYPIAQNQGVTSGFFAVWSMGGMARYQGVFVPNQVIVPSVGYELDQLSYGFNSGQHGSFALSGPVVGLQVLLNWFDPKRGSDFYEASSVSRSYLIAELRELSGSDHTTRVTGESWYFGLRFEL